MTVAASPSSTSFKYLLEDESRKPTILIVDDSPSNLLMLQRYLSRFYDIKTATGGAIALEMLREQKPDLILLDVVMPEMDGYAVIEMIMKNPEWNTIPVIFLTGQQGETHELIGFELGAVDYITKPYKEQLVYRRVRTHLDLKLTRDKLEQQSRVDPLTGIPNRRYFEDFLNFIWGQSVRQKSPLSLLFIDVDGFKHYNDQHGHVQGDLALQAIAQKLFGTKKRSSDLVARVGGDEFVALLSDTPAEGAFVVAEQMRANIESLDLSYGEDGEHRLTLSVGVASTIPVAGIQSKTLIQRADEAVYEAKRAGKNRSFTLS